MEGIIRGKAHETITVSPKSPVGGFRLEGAINDLTVLLLIDTGTSVTLLRKDAWDRVSWASHGPCQLLTCPALGLVGANGSPLLTFGSTLVELELNGAVLPVDVVVVSPLTSEGILGLDFLKKQKAAIDLGSEQIQLRELYLYVRRRHPQADEWSQDR